MIRLTRLADYGVMVMTHLAMHPQSVHAAADVAEEMHLPLPTVSKILGAAARGGLVESRRGLKGGFALARAPESITVAEIVSALEGPIAITDCLDETTADCNLESLCPTRGHWQKINAAIKKALDDVTLNDLTQTPVFPPAEAETGIEADQHK